MIVEEKDPKEWCNYHYKGVSMLIVPDNENVFIYVWEIFSENEGKGEVQEALKELKKEGIVYIMGMRHPAITHICNKLGIDTVELIK